MTKTFTRFIRKSRLFLMAGLFFTSASQAQKSVYDVVPGSGPKKQPASSVYDVTRDKKIKSYPVRRKKHLPPGQAKKIYGGSATDYAPGQVKKDKKWNGKRKHSKHRKHHK